MASVKIRFRCYRCNQLLGAGSSKIGQVIQCPKCGVDLVVPPPSASGQSSDAIARAAPGSFFDAPLDLNEILPEHIRAHSIRNDPRTDERRVDSGAIESSNLDSVIEFEFPGDSGETPPASAETESMREAPHQSAHEHQSDSQKQVIDRQIEIAEPQRSEKIPSIPGAGGSNDSESVVMFPFVVGDRPAPSPSEAVVSEEPAPRSVTTTKAASSREAASQASHIVEPRVVIRARDIVIPRVVVFAWSLLVILGIGMAFVAGLMIGHFLWIVRE